MQNAYKRCPACKGLTESERPFCAGCGCHFAPSVLSAPPPAASVFRSAAKSGFKFPPLSAVPTSARRALGTAAALLAVFLLAYSNWRSRYAVPDAPPYAQTVPAFVPREFHPAPNYPVAASHTPNSNDEGFWDTGAPMNVNPCGPGGVGGRGGRGCAYPSGAPAANVSRFQAVNPNDHPLPDLPKPKKRQTGFGGN